MFFIPSWFLCRVNGRVNERVNGVRVNFNQRAFVILTAVLDRNDGLKEQKTVLSKDLKGALICTKH